jgi:hypothetical protein
VNVGEAKVSIEGITVFHISKRGIEISTGAESLVKVRISAKRQLAIRRIQLEILANLLLGCQQR